MFKKLDVEAVPKRVYELCRIVAQGDIKEKELSEKLFPPEFETPSSSTYFPKVKTAAVEIGLVECTQDSVFKYTGKIGSVDSIDSFRRYCNSYIWSSLKDEYFCKLTSIILESNVDLINNSLSDSTALAYVKQKKPDCPSTLYEDMLALRFWISFLGFGFVTSSKPQFYPNMYVALNDFISFCDFPKEKLISITDFLNKLKSVFDIGIDDAKRTYKLNFAFSSALWTMASMNEIELRRESDSKEMWSLFPTDKLKNDTIITHIVFKGGAEHE